MAQCSGMKNLKVTIALNVLLGAAMLWLISPVCITKFFHFGGSSSAKRAVSVHQVAEKVPKPVSKQATVKILNVVQAATVNENLLTCDDFASSCPQGWSLVASPSLVECGKTCEKETCCSNDAAMDVVEAQTRPARRLLSSGNSTNTTTTTVTTTTTYTATTTTTYTSTDTSTSTSTTTLTTSTTTYTNTNTNTDTKTNTNTDTKTNTNTTTTATTTTTTQTTITNTETTKTDTNTTTTMTTTTITTTTPPVDAETKIEGLIFTEVDNAEQFVQDLQVKDAYEATLAKQLLVPKEWVEVAFEIPSSGSTRLRRLSTEVIVRYTITIPVDQPQTGVGSTVSAATITDALSATSAANDIGQELQSKLDELGVSNYKVTVKTIQAPVVTFETVTTTTSTSATTTIGEEVEDAFAFTKVAVGPAHALALLAVAMSALSF